MTKNTEKSKYKLIYFALIVQLIFLYFVKYLNQSLSLFEFSIFKTGNLFNLLIYSGLAFGIYISHNKQAVSGKGVKAFVVITWILLAGSFISTKIKIIPGNSYFLGLPSDKVLTGLFFLSYLIIFIYFLIFIWTGNFSSKKISFKTTVLNTLALFFLFLLTILVYSDNAGYTSGRWSLNKNDENVVVVLGAAVWSGNIPSPTLSSRVDKAIEILQKGFAGKIILTGGSAPGEMTESEVAFQYAKLKGVDTSKIVTESRTSSTTEQIRWIKNNLIPGELKSVELILISDSYHLPRVIEISKFFNLNIKVAESTHKLDFKDKLFNRMRECIALFNFWCFAL